MLSPPVSSEPTSQASQPESVQASHTTGGRRGSTPRPDTRQSIRSSTAQLGTALDNPTSNASPGTGGEEKHRKPAAPRAAVLSTGEPPDGWDPARSKAHGTISSSRVVLKTTGSLTSVRGVAAWDSLRTSTDCGWGADSQKVTSPLAAAGARSSTPISSRNLM